MTPETERRIAEIDFYRGANCRVPDEDVKFLLSLVRDLHVEINQLGVTIVALKDVRNSARATALDWKRQYEEQLGRADGAAACEQIACRERDDWKKMATRLGVRGFIKQIEDLQGELRTKERETLELAAQVAIDDNLHAGIASAIRALIPPESPEPK